MRVQGKDNIAGERPARSCSGGRLTAALIAATVLALGSAPVAAFAADGGAQPGSAAVQQADPPAADPAAEPGVPDSPAEPVDPRSTPPGPPVESAAPVMPQEPRTADPAPQPAAESAPESSTDLVEQTQGAADPESASTERTGGGDDGPYSRIKICHVSGGPGTYVAMTVTRQEAVTEHAGLGHEGGGDIIPAFEYEQGGETVSFGGQNWDGAGQAIYDFGCKDYVPVQEPTISVDVPACPGPGGEFPAEISVLVGGLVEGRTYTASLATAGGATDAQIVVATGAEMTLSFALTGPGEYTASVGGAGIGTVSQTFQMEQCEEPVVPPCQEEPCEEPPCEGAGEQCAPPCADEPCAPPTEEPPTQRTPPLPRVAEPAPLPAAQSTRLAEGLAVTGAESRGSAAGFALALVGLGSAALAGSALRRRSRIGAAR